MGGGEVIRARFIFEIPLPTLLGIYTSLLGIKDIVIAEKYPLFLFSITILCEWKAETCV